MKSKAKLIIPLALALAAVVSVGTAVQAAGFDGFKPNLTEDQIEVLEQSRELHRQGDDDAALELLENSDLPDEFVERIKDRHKDREAVHEAIEDGDYEAFRDLVGDHRIGEIIDTEDEFELLVEAHKLRDEGEMEEAREILDELGLHPPHRHPHPQS